MSKTPIAWYRSPSEDAPDGEAVYGPEFIGVARRKLDDLLASGWRVSGVSIERANQDGTVSRGAVTTGGMVLWWHARQPQQEPVAVPQWRKPLCCNWYDGHPDNSDGGGPYETRVLYTSPPARDNQSWYSVQRMQ